MTDFLMSCFTLSVIRCICNRLNLCWTSDIGRRQEVKNRQDGSECYIILVTSDCTARQYRVTYYLQNIYRCTNFIIFYILSLNNILSVLFLDTQHRENLQNRGTGNPYPNQNMIWTEMLRMAFRCRQWYRMELWEPLMEHNGAPAANISVATEELRVLWGFPWLLQVFIDPWWRLILCSLHISK